LSASVQDGRVKTAFVFAGGGSFGAIQVGMMHALAANGVSADIVVGSSVGAINGAYYAGNPTLKGVLQLETIWRGLRRYDVFPVTWRTLLGFIALISTGRSRKSNRFNSFPFIRAVSILRPMPSHRLPRTRRSCRRGWDRG